MSIDDELFENNETNNELPEEELNDITGGNTPQEKEKGKFCKVCQRRFNSRAEYDGHIRMAMLLGINHW